ncbi:putative glycosyl hydrolase family 79 C-terminal beta domain [Lyophyllum shimeji]|uniref:Glycosyl hydrolase family 79 C-terminal beta domain n=1 Tax=Lyophyllum shimeji TaxID=47721 RepID=A0A9P3PX88_LYOSH|nr:putative glycosyl hydrolase family 79 C-terminal beta domain [Lyophyllum shimeji]
MMAVLGANFRAAPWLSAIRQGRSLSDTPPTWHPCGASDVAHASPPTACSAAFLATVPQLTLAGKPLDVSFPERPPASALQNVVDDHFIGISWELSSFDTLWGKTTKTIPSAMQNYLHNIAARMSRPLRIRVGGNGMDGSTYVPNLPTFLELTDPDAYFNDVPVNFGPIMFEVNLASDAEKQFGDRLDAFLLGNEPDLYAGHGERGAYDIPTYVTEIGSTLNDLGEAGLLEEKLIGGPTICCGWNLSAVLDAGLDHSVQRYPQHSCGGPDEKNTNISYYLSHQNVAPYLNWQQEGMAKAQANNVPVLLTEYNTVACGGSNISSTFAASLWAVDVGLKAASVNYSAIYLHTRWTTGSPYYAALFLAEITDPSGSVVVDLNLNNSNTSPAASVAAYGIYDHGGASRGKLALINYAESSNSEETATQVFRIPGGISESVQIRLLLAPSVLERQNISWAGQTVGDNGDLHGIQVTIRKDCADGCEVDVPSPGAALVLMSGSQFFTGNSTIAGAGGYLSGAAPASVASSSLRFAALLCGLSAVLSLAMSLFTCDVDVMSQTCV